MCNIEKDIGGNSRNLNLKIYYCLSQECMTKLASHTGCTVYNMTADLHAEEIPCQSSLILLNVFLPQCKHATHNYEWE